jgi:Xaa-Pro aminopeptidase
VDGDDRSAVDAGAGIWTTIRDARDAAIGIVQTHVAAGYALRGGDVDDVARKVIVDRGLGEYFTHRTGHSIDSRRFMDPVRISTISRRARSGC